jgi:hypothetical protein
MFNSKALKQSKPTIAVTPRNPSTKLAIMPNSVPTQDRISERAYALYESRGRERGQDKQDWFRAELELSEAQN